MSSTSTFDKVLQDAVKLVGHTNVIVGISISPRADFVATACFDGSLRIFSLLSRPSGKLLALLSTVKVGASSISYSPDGRYLLTASEDRTAKIWEASEMKLVHSIAGHQEKVLDAKYSSNNKYIATASHDKTAILWSGDGKSRLKDLRGHSGWVFSVSFSKSSTLLATGSDDKTVRVWRVQDGHCVHTLAGHSGLVYDVAFSPDGEALASGSVDKSVKIWRVTSDKATLWTTLEGHDAPVKCLAWHQSGRLLANSATDGSVRVWALKEAQRWEVAATAAAREGSGSCCRICWVGDKLALPLGPMDAMLATYPVKEDTPPPVGGGGGGPS
jgi:WD40 repeat protein